MKSMPKITDTEWEIMRIVWARHPLTASEVLEQLAAADPSWHPKTAHTLLARLVQKQALGYEARGRAYVYSPLVTEEAALRTASASFLERFFGGSLQPMLMHFVGQQRLSKAEVAELTKLLNAADSSKPKGKGEAQGNDDRTVA